MNTVRGRTDGQTNEHQAVYCSNRDTNLKYPPAIRPSGTTLKIVSDGSTHKLRAKSNVVGR